jgi:hypothetical protein
MATRPVGIKVDFSKCKWATPDEETAMLIPKEGVFKDVLNELIASADAPAIYHLAAVFTTSAVALSQCDLCIGDLRNPFVVPMSMWSAVIGESGDRKSSALERAVNSLQQVMPERMFPSDASTEGWQLALSEQPISLLYRDELSGLFDATQRSYSNSLRSWLLETWTGHTLIRKTLTHKECVITRPRLSVLGGIPPSVFAEKTTRADWRSGFLARFIYWGGKRQKWSALPYGNESGKYTKWLNTVAKPSTGTLHIPEQNAEPLFEWTYQNVELTRSLHKPEVESTFQRLQVTGYKLAAIIEMSKRDRPFAYGSSEQVVEVSEASVVSILPILDMMKSTIEQVFADSSMSKDLSEENQILRLFTVGVKLTRKDVADTTGLGSKKVNAILTDLTNNEQLLERLVDPVGGKAGAKRKIYFKNTI